MRKRWVAALAIGLVTAAAGCGEMSDEEAAAEVVAERPTAEWIADLKEGKPDVRVLAARVLAGAEPSPLVLGELLAALEDESVEVRKAAGRTLQRIGGETDEVMVALARAIRNDPAGAGDVFWMRGADGNVTSPAAVKILLDDLMDPNLSWAILEKAARMLHAADEEVALAAIPADLSPERREVLSVLVRKGPSFRLVRSVERLIGDPVRSESEFIRRDADGLLDAECAKAPFARKRRDPGPIRGKRYSAEDGAVPRIEVRATEEETGEPVVIHAVFLQDGGTREYRGPVSGGTWSAREAPRAGDVLGIYARGYDLARVTLTGTENVVSVRLQRAAGRFVVGPVRPAECVGEVRAQATINLVYDADGRKRALIRDACTLKFDPDGTAAVPVPEGLTVNVYIDTPGDGLVWPPAVRAVAGGRAPISVERPRRTEILLPGPGYFGEPALSSDLTANPGWPKHKVDALTGWRAKYEPIFVVKDEKLYLDAPDTGWHLFARWEGRRFYLRIPARAEEVRIPPDPVKRVAGRPVVDGEPVPDLSIVAPGWLDLDSIRGIGVRGHRAEGYSYAIHQGSRWEDVTLPSAEWLTVWHPDKGIAWLEWQEGIVPAGKWLPGRIEIRGEPGQRLTGTARIHPSWPAAGTVSVGSTFEPLERSFEDVEAIVLPGLPDGTYRVYFQLTLHREGAEPEETSGRFFAAIDEGDPVQVFAPDGGRR
jgi:hypothetical protein